MEAIAQGDSPVDKLVSKRRFSISALALLLAALLLSACSPPKEQVTPATSELKGKITVSGAFALYPMMVKWAEEFQKINPGVRIDVSAGGAGKGAADALAGLVDIGMVSRGVFPAEVEKGAFYVGSVVDAVVLIASAANPVQEDLLARGIKRQGLVDIWITGKTTDWKDLFPGANAFGKTGLHVYTRSDAAGAPETWALYLGQKQEDLLGTGVYGDPGLAETVRRDPLGIGFNNIGYVYDARSRKQVEGLLVIPIDLNENGRIDPEENFYSTLDEITLAIAAGVYPSPPARDLNLVTLREFRGVTREFVKWILTEGQRYAPEAGYVPLSEEKLRRELEKLG
jgi:phosphate transport system substrate-binding protein